MDENTLKQAIFIKDVIVAVVGFPLACCTLLIARKGLNTWSRQLKGNTEYDLARRLLVTVYRVRESINYIRNSYVSANEMKMPIEKMSEYGGYSNPELAFAYHNRLKQLNKKRIKLQLVHQEAKAVFSRESTLEVESLLNIVVELSTHVQKYIRYNNKNKSNSPSTNDTIQKSIDIIEGSVGPDIFQDKLDDVINKIEIRFRKHIDIHRD